MADDVASFQSLVQAIVASYKSDPRTRHVDTGNLPNRDAIIELTLAQVAAYVGERVAEV